MPPLLSIVLGCLLVLVAVSDLIWSTLSTSGAGAVSHRVADGLWRTARGVHRRVNSHRLLEASSPVIVVAVVGVWIVLLWAGWILIFTSSPEAVVDATSRVPAGFPDRVYFVGFTLFTLGIGDFTGGAPVWRVLTSVASINGLFAITLAITYLLPIVSAATAKRQLALLMHSQGDTAESIVTNGWNGEDFSGLENQLRDITSLLLLHSERHLAYPVLHYFHSSEPKAALAPRILALDDAVTLLSHCVDPSQRPDGAVLNGVKDALDVFIERIQHRFVDQANEAPPVPDLEAIDATGVTLAGEAKCQRAFDERMARRKLLLGFVQGDGW